MIVEFMYYLCHSVFVWYLVFIIFGCGSLKIVKTFQTNNSYSLKIQENSYLFFLQITHCKRMNDKNAKRAARFTFGSPSSCIFIDTIAYFDGFPIRIYCRAGDGHFISTTYSTLCRTACEPSTFHLPLSFRRRTFIFTLLSTALEALSSTYAVSPAISSDKTTKSAS